MWSNQASSSINYSQQIQPFNKHLSTHIVNPNENFYLMFMKMNQEINCLKNEMKNQETNFQKKLNNQEKIFQTKLNNQEKNYQEILRYNLRNQEKILKGQLYSHIKNSQNKIDMLNEELKIQKIKYETKLNIIENNISSLKTNYDDLMKEITNEKKQLNKINSIESLVNNISNEIVTIKKENNPKEILELSKKIEGLIKILDEVLKERSDFIENLGILCEKVSKLLKEINYLGKLQKLEKQIEDLKEKNNQLQIIIISRKLIKIILKYIISNCLESFTLEEKSNKLNSSKIKGNTKFDKNKVMGILNKLIDKNKESNFIMHIEGAINDHLEILKKLGTEIYLNNLIELLNVDKKTKDYLFNIAEYYNINNSDVHNEIPPFDPDINELLNDLQIQLEKNSNK